MTHLNVVYFYSYHILLHRTKQHLDQSLDEVRESMKIDTDGLEREQSELSLAIESIKQQAEVKHLDLDGINIVIFLVITYNVQ